MAFAVTAWTKKEERWNVAADDFIDSGGDDLG
jgi:hypothetical protein